MQTETNENRTIFSTVPKDINAEFLNDGLGDILMGLGLISIFYLPEYFCSLSIPCDLVFSIMMLLAFPYAFILIIITRFIRKLLLNANHNVRLKYEAPVEKRKFISGVYFSLLKVAYFMAIFISAAVKKELLGLLITLWIVVGTAWVMIELGYTRRQKKYYYLLILFLAIGASLYGLIGISEPLVLWLSIVDTWGILLMIVGFITFYRFIRSTIGVEEKEARGN